MIIIYILRIKIIVSRPFLDPFPNDSRNDWHQHCLLCYNYGMGGGFQVSVCFCEVYFDYWLWIVIFSLSKRPYIIYMAFFPWKKAIEEKVIIWPLSNRPFLSTSLVSGGSRLKSRRERGGWWYSLSALVKDLSHLNEGIGLVKVAVHI